MKEIEQNQLTRYGHVQRMAEGRLHKIALKWMPKQGRARGRPKKNWMLPRNFLRGGGGQQIQLRTEDRENGDLGAVAPYSGILEAAVILYKKFHFIQ
jgi:hypothetical protein